MATNQNFVERRDNSVARAIAYSATFTAARAEGSEVWDVEGTRYVDFCGGIGCQNVGHRHPKVIAAIQAQLSTLTHTCFQVSPYESYIKLAERLNALAPGDFTKKSLFFSAGGEAIENAVKIARHHTGRAGLITFTNGYHGRSYMGMALSGRRVPFKTGFRPFPSEVYRLPFVDPFRSVSLDDTKRAFENLFRSDAGPEDIAAIFFEPVQGEGGYNIADAEFLRYLRTLCDQHGIVLVADEIQTGIGRSGKMFAMEHFDVSADLTCIGKSLGGGLPLSGVVGRSDIIDCVPPGGLGGTFGGNPLACAAALALLEVIEEDNLLSAGLEMGQRIDTRLRKFATKNSIDFIGDVRALGCMNCIEIVTDKTTNAPDGDLCAQIVNQALQEGVLLLSAGPARNVIRFLPALNTSLNLIDEGLDCLERALDQVASIRGH